MLDIGWPELMIILVVAVIVIGPKDLPKTMYTVGKWVRAARRMTGQVQRQFDDAMREAELDEIRQGLKKASPGNIKKQIEKTIDPTGTLTKATDLGSGKSVKQYLKEGLVSDDKAAAKDEPAKEQTANGSAAKATSDEAHLDGEEGADKVAIAGVQEQQRPKKVAKPASAKADPKLAKVEGEGADVTPKLDKNALRSKQAEPVAADGDRSS